MADLTQRIRKAINWLIYCEVAENERALAELLGYTKSSFSQIVNGKVPLSEKFVKKLCSLDANINEVWILEGRGEFLKVNTPNGIKENVVIPASAWEVIQKQADSLAVRDKQIDKLIGMLHDQLQESKKADVRTEERATSAVAV